MEGDSRREKEVVYDGEHVRHVTNSSLRIILYWPLLIITEISFASKGNLQDNIRRERLVKVASGNFHRRGLLERALADTYE